MIYLRPAPELVEVFTGLVPSAAQDSVTLKCSYDALRSRDTLVDVSALVDVCARIFITV